MSLQERRNDTGEETTNPVAQARAELRDFFQIDDPEFAVLRFQLRKQWLDLIQSNPYYAASLSHQIIEPRREPLDTTLIAVTSSPRKRAVIASLAQEYGLNAKFVYTADEEEDIHEMVRHSPHFPDNYAPQVAHWKVKDYISGSPAVGLDTVRMGGLPIEKPTTLEQARDQIMSFVGKTFEVVTGIDLALPTRSGRVIYLNQMITLGLNARNFTANDVMGYMASAPHLFDTSGSVNLVDPSAQQLFLDQAAPITIFTSGPWGEKTMRMAPSVIEALATYFMGVPEDPLRALFGKIQSIYETLTPEFFRPISEDDALMDLSLVS